MSQSPVPDFLRTFSVRRVERLEPFLDEAVVYEVSGLDAVEGRRAVLAFWRRMFETYGEIGMGLVRHVADEDIVLAEQRQVFVPHGRPPVILDNLAVYQLRGGRIRSWREYVDLEAAGPDEVALWRRLRTARW
ncbi:MAG: nuclear transport factor 2 family protein [Brevundimonas sp.]|jgi:limonene-1,2-epoxide hydrolase|uniref:nuclear transport factor 2 family protein n=1 Tax=Brevundimonas sp. TaxID=1871086 RepID=UPI00391C7400